MIVITTPTGLIGHQVLDTLLDSGEPLRVIARDPSVLKGIGGWKWQSGLLPSPHAPVWPMSSFRNRFLTAFGPRQGR